MATVTTKPRTFYAKIAGEAKRRVWIPVPFDPATVWGKREKYHVGGTVGGKNIRGLVERGGNGWLMSLGAAWRRDHGTKPGDDVAVTLAIEGPQRDMLAPDLAVALKKEPQAAAFWDSVAQFYRKGYLTWIDATKKRPEERTRRIAEVVRLLKAGRKQR